MEVISELIILSQKQVIACCNKRAAESKDGAKKTKKQKGKGRETLKGEIDKRAMRDRVRGRQGRGR